MPSRAFIGSLPQCLIVFAAILSNGRLPHAQEHGQDTQQLEEVTVTGTRLKRVDEEDLQPLIVITRQDLDASGQTSIAGVLRDLTQNSFGPSTDRDPSSTDNGATTANLRGLGPQYTLVLLNGVPLVGSPSQSGGDVQNLNVLPWGAIDRIEILSDGASAVYGSKAVGGVINIITRANFSGALVTVQADRPTGAGADANSASFLAGGHGDTAQGLLSIEYSKTEPLFARQRPFLPPQFSFNSSPPSFRRDDPSGVADAAWHPGAGCPSALGADPRFPNSVLGDVFDDGSQYCYYNFIADAEQLAALERKTLLAQGSYQLGGGMDAHALLLVSRNRSRGEIAAASSGSISDAIAADSPFNPTLGEVAPGLGYPLDLRYRPIAAGHRLIDGADHVEQLTAGLGGNRIGDWEATWRIDLTGTHYGQQIDGRNFASVSRFEDAVAGGTFDPFADPATQDFSQFITSIRNRASHRTQEVSAQLQPARWSLFDVPLETLVGVEAEHESFTQRDDPAAIAGDLFGALGTSAGGTRDHHAEFAEADWNPNGRWQLKLAVRRDDYSDAGGALSPKIAAMWKPVDSVLLRASAGKGFHVPDLVTLGGTLSSFTESLPDPLGCGLRPSDPLACGEIPRDIFFLPNPKLDPETARQLNAGFIYSPARDFSVGVQAFQTHFTDAITSLDEFLVLNNDVDCHDAGRACDLYKQGLVERGVNGEITRILVPLSVNAASSLTRGYDADLRVGHDIGSGRLDGQISYSRLTFFEQRFPGGSSNAPLGYLGFPNDRMNVTLAWSQGAWRASTTAHVIGRQRNCDVQDPQSPTCADHVPRYTTIDAQVSWSANDHLNLSAGARNLADRKPFINYLSTFSPGLYDITGRVLYLRLEWRPGIHEDQR
jgi:iron complex outermembrane receptor protein